VNKKKNDRDVIRSAFSNLEVDTGSSADLALFIRLKSSYSMKGCGDDGEGCMAIE